MRRGEAILKARELLGASAEIRSPFELWTTSGGKDTRLLYSATSWAELTAAIERNVQALQERIAKLEEQNAKIQRSQARILGP